MARASYHHKNLPEALLAASVALLETHGIAGFSLREAARQVGVDPAACYRHFRDRDAILTELARRGFGELASRMAAELAKEASRSAERRLLVLGQAYLEFASARPAIFRTMFGPTGREARDPRHRGAHPEGLSPYQLLEASLLEWASAAKLELALDDAALMLWSAVHGLASLLVDGAVRLEPSRRDRICASLIGNLLAGIAQTSGSPKATTRVRRKR